MRGAKQWTYFFPTFYSKTFFILGLQLVITWAATVIMFYIFRYADPKLDTNTQTDEQLNSNAKPEWRWLFSKGFLNSICIVWFIGFLILRLWGLYQSLPVSMAMFILWAALTGVMLERVLIQFDHGTGRRVAATTAAITLAMGAFGMTTNLDLGFLRWPLFLGLLGLVLVQFYMLFRHLSSNKQRLTSSFGIGLFTLYLVYDFNTLAKKSAAGINSWPDAAISALKIYLDIINLLLQLLSKHHHH